MASVWVYKLDGTLQCDMGKEISLEQGKKELATLIGAKSILAAEKRHVPLMFPDLCGAPTGNANVYEITEEGLYILFHGFVGPMGFALWSWGTPKRLSKAKLAEDRPVPWPWSKLAKDGAEPDAMFANLISSLTQVGTHPTEIVDLIGRRCRCYKQGDPLTMDFMPERVNVELNDGGTIHRIWFG